MTSLFKLVALLSLATTTSAFINGVNFGGLFILETSWMYDKFEAACEADFVAQLIKEDGLDYAIQTFRNHWNSYIPVELYDMLSVANISHVRLPVGFHTFDTPLTDFNTTMYNYGLSAEGFVTGGVNHVLEVVAELKDRGIKVILDVHAQIGGASKCSAYSGWSVANANESFWQGSPATNSASCASSGFYQSRRSSDKTYLEYGAEMVTETIVPFIVGLQQHSVYSDTIVGLELINEPGLSWNNLESEIQQYIMATAPSAHKQFSEAKLDVQLILNFISPNQDGMAAWVKAQQTSGALPAILIDYHNYYNWDGPLTMDEALARSCNATETDSRWSQYTDAGLPTFIGEWSTATNLGDPAFSDVDNATVAKFLSHLYANQVSVILNSKNVVGHCHWTARMGSGWDPRPTSADPNGRQDEGTSFKKSHPSFGNRLWNWAEMMDLGIFKPLFALDVTGRCACEGCQTHMSN
ncbi:uncharacterized protein MONBRDRAFT_30302 [Monosiga brevicollis MX1]|uniref:glucan 1,3-beta-glucosidase n=1 Tax=Monosiga brevicollis TaxID=81824 RepID=A9VDK4_MONBE|nr:uncharacterized protein MONBRDRAFT_30302 [Monosiga brevicollis MX1]EDQ84411.1 predicted protein [Monosiga brevicollis MX1]|eukprot:XP_001750812.1 hypothetical protein [Monosiga brevicollis MX1]